MNFILVEVFLETAYQYNKELNNLLATYATSSSYKPYIKRIRYIALQKRPGTI